MTRIHIDAAVDAIVAGRESAAVYHVRAMHAALAAASGIAAAFLDDHPSDCGCPGCDGDIAHRGLVLKTVRIVDAFGKILADELEGNSEVVIPTDRAVSFADDLTRAAALMRRAEAAYDREGAGDDRPGDEANATSGTDELAGGDAEEFESDSNSDGEPLDTAAILADLRRDFPRLVAAAIVLQPGPGLPEVALRLTRHYPELCEQIAGRMTFRGN